MLILQAIERFLNSAVSTWFPHFSKKIGRVYNPVTNEGQGL